MHRFEQKFPFESIPHVTDNDEINDILHNYKIPKAAKDPIPNIVQKARQETKNLSKMAVKILTPTSSRE